MTLRQKQLFVSGFLDGHAEAQEAFCHNMDTELQSIRFRPEVGSLDDPCKQLQSTYSHIEYGKGQSGYTNAYVSVIDEFYKHPECRMMPYTVLLEHLNDKEYKSGEELYKAVRLGQAHMGAFSGFDGIEKCLGVDAKR